MTMATTTPGASISASAGAGPRFDKLADMQAAHAALLKQQRDEGNLPEVPAIEDFIARGRATGAVLDGDAEREDAQIMLDYWATRLVRAGRDLPDTALADFDPEQLPMLPDEPCPYRGLEAFTSDAFSTVASGWWAS